MRLQQQQHQKQSCPPAVGASGERMENCKDAGEDAHVSNVGGAGVASGCSGVPWHLHVLQDLPCYLADGRRAIVHAGVLRGHCACRCLCPMFVPSHPQPHTNTSVFCLGKIARSRMSQCDGVSAAALPNHNVPFQKGDQADGFWRSRR